MAKQLTHEQHADILRDVEYMKDLSDEMYTALGSIPSIAQLRELSEQIREISARVTEMLEDIEDA